MAPLKGRVYAKRRRVRRVKRITRMKPKRLPRKPMVNLIKNTIYKMAEIKSVNTDPVTYAFNANNTTCSPAVDLCTPLNQIASGNIDGSRIGNRIRLVKYDLRMTFNINSSYSSSGTFRGGYVQVWLATLKGDKFGQPNATDLTRIYNDGSGSGGPDQTVLQSMRDLNRDYYNFRYYKKFKLGPAGGNYVNNDFPAQRFLTIRNIFKKGTQVTWNDSFTQPDKAMYMFCHFVECTGATLTVTVPVDCQYYISCRYIDL